MSKHNANGLIAGVAAVALIAAAPAMAQTTNQGTTQPSDTIQTLPPVPGGQGGATQQGTGTTAQPIEGTDATEQTAQPMDETEADVQIVDETDAESDVEIVDTETQSDVEVVDAEAGSMNAMDDLEVQGGFVVAQRETNIMGSDLMDANVMTTADESLGSVNDILMDGEGRTLAVVVGVGGFLGIGQKDVAIPVSSVQLIFENERGADGSAVPVSGRVEEPLSTGAGGEIAYLLVDFTRDQLEEAPEFERWRPEPQATGATPPAGGMAPGGGMGGGAATPGQPAAPAQ